MPVYERTLVRTEKDLVTAGRDLVVTSESTKAL